MNANGLNGEKNISGDKVRISAELMGELRRTQAAYLSRNEVAPSFNDLLTDAWVVYKAKSNSLPPSGENHANGEVPSIGVVNNATNQNSPLHDVPAEGVRLLRLLVKGGREEAALNLLRSVLEYGRTADVAGGGPDVDRYESGEGDSGAAAIERSGRIAEEFSRKAAEDAARPLFDPPLPERTKTVKKRA